MIDNTIDTEVTMRDAASVGGAKRFRPGDEILGRYVVESELGQGGMGVVYLCLDKVGGVKVAVKGLPPEVSHNSDEMESVRENFQLVSELQHPNISGVRTLEKDEKTGDYYLVMAYAHGVSLKHWLRQHGGKGHRGGQLKVLRQIASALDYAHNAEPRHIIHRDIKPENIMVDERGNVSVLDFGLAAQVRSSLSRVSQVVTSRSGTPAYKSPEQWLAQAQRAPSDQYSLGVIAYQMFAGELPYDSDDIEILKHAVVFDSVPAIPGESKSVNAVLAKVLAKKPQERFTSCAAFVDALGRARAPAAPSRRMYALVILGVLAIGALVGGGWWWRERVKSEELRVKNEALAAERARKDEEAKRNAEDARLAAEKVEAERKTKVEAKRVAEEKIEVERKANAEVERMAKLEEERKARAEAERLVDAKRKTEESRIVEEKRKEVELPKPVPQRMLEALWAMGQDFAKCKCDEYASLGIPLMSAILTFAQDIDKATDERQRLLEALTENHPQVLGLANRIEVDKRHLAESISMSAEIVERYATSYDADEKSVLAMIETDILTYEFFERKISVSLKVRLRVFYDAYIAGLWKRRDLLTVYTEVHPEVKAVDSPMHEAEKSFKANVRAYRVSQGWIKEPQPNAAVELTGKAGVKMKTSAACQACDFCKGTGRRPCLECGPIRNQAGEVVCEHGMTCSVCGGSGRRSVGGFFPEPCSDCRGRGWERHAKCAGSGFLPGVCSKCDGKKVIYTETE